MTWRFLIIIEKTKSDIDTQKILFEQNINHKPFY
jgi:hypothetical protein